MIAINELVAQTRRDYLAQRETVIARGLWPTAARETATRHNDEQHDGQPTAHISVDTESAGRLPRYKVTCDKCIDTQRRERMSDEKTHWIEDDATRRKFWAYAKGDLGLTEDEVHKALLCEHIAEFAGDKIAALECLNTYANSKILIAMGLQDAEHAEARTITYCDVYAPDGTRISVTAREGALAGDVARTAETLWRAVEYLTANGWKTPGAEMQPVRKAAKPAPVTKKPPTPLSPSPSAPPTGNPPPPPAPPSGNGGPAPTTTGDVLQTDFVKVTAPKGKPVVEFWRPNRKYAEIRFHLGGEALMKMSPTLAAKGWLAEHFDTVGEEYTLALNVHWEPSKPDGKYKDITKIELR